MDNNEENKTPSDNKQEPQQPEKFELRLVETGVVTGSMPITWCVDKDWLAKNNDTDQWVLLCTAPPNKNGVSAQWRGYCRLVDMMAYITFYRPGKNRILARVTPSKISGIYNWMKRDCGAWVFDAMDFGNAWDVEEPSFLLSKEWKEPDRLWNYIDVDIPGDCFAKEPSDFEKGWVNFFYKEKAVDQCEFRKRRMIAYTFQPISFLLCLLVFCIGRFSATIINSLIGQWVLWEKGFFLHPFTVKSRYDFLKIDAFGDWYWVFYPAPLLSVIVSFVLTEIFHNSWYLLVAPGVLLAVLVFFGVLVFFVSRKPIRISLREKRQQEKEAAELVRIQAEFESLDMLFCSSPKRITRIKDLPKPKRTIKLRFNGLKGLVCKPFAK